MTLVFETELSQARLLHEELLRIPPISYFNAIASFSGAGIYQFLEATNIRYVGRTRNIKRRLRSHITANHHSASFAYKRLKIFEEIGADRLKALGRKTAVVQFQSQFQHSISEVSAMDVRFINVTSPVQQYLLEVLAHLAAGLPPEDFETH